MSRYRLVVSLPEADPPLEETLILNKMYYLYILLGTKPNWHYIGSTDNLKRRFKDHNAGKVKSTRPYRPLKIIHIEEYESRTLVRKRETFLKKTAKARVELFKSIMPLSSSG